jgi:hypothetical protein
MVPGEETPLTGTPVTRSRIERRTGEVLELYHEGLDTPPPVTQSQYEALLKLALTYHTHGAPAGKVGMTHFT